MSRWQMLGDFAAVHPCGLLVIHRDGAWFAAWEEARMSSVQLSSRTMRGAQSAAMAAARRHLKSLEKMLCAE